VTFAVGEKRFAQSKQRQSFGSAVLLGWLDRKAVPVLIYRLTVDLKIDESSPSTEFSVDSRLA
jgi:hypothetical protein